MVQKLLKNTVLLLKTFNFAIVLQEIRYALGVKCTSEIAVAAAACAASLSQESAAPLCAPSSAHVHPSCLLSCRARLPLPWLPSIPKLWSSASIPVTSRLCTPDRFDSGIKLVPLSEIADDGHQPSGDTWMAHCGRSRQLPPPTPSTVERGRGQYTPGAEPYH